MCHAHSVTEVPMTDPRGQRPTELRIKAPGWNFYGWTFLIWLLGVVLAVFYWGLEAVVLVYGPDYQVGGLDYRVGIVNQSWAILVGGVGTLLTLSISGLAIYGAAQSWRHWRRFRLPGVVVDADGIRFEARRRPLMIPWPQVERLELKRSVFKHKSTTRYLSRLRVRLSPGSDVLRADASPVSTNRWLYIGHLEEHISVSYEDAIEILKRTAGLRLELIED
jgi:hypothetical protein